MEMEDRERPGEAITVEYRARLLDVDITSRSYRSCARKRHGRRARRVDWAAYLKARMAVVNTPRIVYASAKVLGV